MGNDQVVQKDGYGVGGEGGAEPVMLQRWKYKDLIVLLMWAWKHRVLLRIIPIFLTQGERRTKEFSTTTQNL